MNDPREVWRKYNDAQRIAEDEYRNYWLQKLAANGVHFKLENYRHVLTIGRYEIDCFVCPRQFEGIKFSISEKGTFGYRNVKVMSESGFKKFLRLLQDLSR